MDRETTDTIVALASGKGEAGVAVLRLSGPAAHEVLGRVFHGRGGGRQWRPGQLMLGKLAGASGELIDECLAVCWWAPASFTGEDVAEIQCHGGMAIIRETLEACMAAGCRLAEPGEFSRRAFLNGKMDLAQAEALSDLIAARSESARRLALRQLRGGLSEKLRGIYSGLIDGAAEIEAHLDFPEEDIPALAQDRIAGRMAAAMRGLELLMAGYRKGRVERTGVRVVLAGNPNAGKSSLFNALVGRERAIVSPHPGTTRDTIEATLEIDGLEVTLVDTAGIRDAAEEVEQIGIEKTWQELREGDLILYLADRVEELENPSWELPEGVPVIKILTKQDAGGAPGGGEAVAVSTVTGLGIAGLERRISDVAVGTRGGEEADMSRERHAECVRRAMESLERAESAFGAGLSGDLVMVDLRDAISALGEILGERLDEQILDRIFSTFCLGK